MLDHNAVYQIRNPANAYLQAPKKDSPLRLTAVSDVKDTKMFYFMIVPQKGYKNWYQIRSLECDQDIHLEPDVELVMMKNNGCAWYIREISKDLYEIRQGYGNEDNLLCRRGTQGVKDSWDYNIRVLLPGPSTHGTWMFLKVSNPGNVPKYPEGDGSTLPVYRYIAQPGESYVIRSVATNTVIHFEPGTGSAKGKIFARKANGSNNQKWLATATGLGVNVTLQGLNKQHFKYPKFEKNKNLEPSTTSNGYFIGPAPKGYYIYPAERPDHVVDVRGGETADGTEICLWPINGEEHQMWYFEEV